MKSRKPALSRLLAAAAIGAAMALGLGAQTMDQAALAQALAAAQAAQGPTLPTSSQQAVMGGLTAQATATTGTAPTMAPQQPVVGALSAPGAGTSAAAATSPVAAKAAQTSAQTAASSLSPIEQMFSGQALALGAGTQALQQFGYSLFANPTAPSLAAIGDDYVLGPGDGLVLYLWGDPVDIKELSASYTLTVDRNGAIFLPPTGQLPVLGQDLGSVRSVIKGMLDRRYKRLDMSLTLASLRQFPVFVSGYAGAPGTVLATGADTVLTVLSRAGGIAETGSLRAVRLTRGSGAKAVITMLDFYDTLISGSSVDLRVKEGDSLYVPAIGPAVAVAGEVRRPGIYELSGESTAAQVLALAGGLLPSARGQAAARLRFSDAGRSLVIGSLSDAAFASSKAADGDLYYLGTASDLLLGRVELSGPVKYPGRYDLASAKSLSALLARAQVLPETNLFYGRVYRADVSGRDRSFAFSLKDVMAGKDQALAEFDRVVLYRWDDVAVDPDFDRFPDTLVVSGSAKYPGFYLYKDGASLAGLLSENALTLDASRTYAEVQRTRADGTKVYLSFSPDAVLSGAADLKLARLDQIRFAAKGAEAASHDFDKYPDAVLLSGQVARPEVFALSGGLRLSQVLVKDQVLLDTNLNYAELTRLRPDGKNEYIVFSPAEILAGAADLALGPRDSIKLVKVGYSPERPDFDRFDRAVQVSGPAQFGGLYAWKPGMRLSGLLALAKPLAEANQVFAELARPLGGGRFEYLTFAPREVAAGGSDLELKAKDVVRLYSMAPVPAAKQGAEATAPLVAPTPSVPSTMPLAAPAPAVPAAAAPAGVAPAGVAPAGTVPTQAAAAAPPAGNTAAVLPAASPQALAGAEVFSDLDRFVELVTTSGAIRYAGPYARTPSLKLSSVVTADQILESTNMEYAELTRLKPDGTYEYRTFAPREVLDGKFDLDLRAKDAVRLVKKTAFGGAAPTVNLDQFPDAVVLTGQVARPEVYAFRSGLKLSALLTQSQVLLSTNQSYAELLRTSGEGKETYVTFRPSAVLDATADLDLQPRDRIRLVKTGYAPDKPDFDRYVEAVQVLGPVQYGGLYAWKRGMRLSELFALAKPLLEANKYYGEVVRPLGGGRFEYLTFAPREVAAGASDLELKAKDVVRLYTTAPVAAAKQGSAETAAPPAPPAPAAAAAGAPAGSAPAQATAAPPAGDSAAAVPAASPQAPAGAEGFPDLNRFLELVTTSGAVRYAGPYARTSNLKLSSVVTADQMLEETNLNYAELTRLKADGGYEYLAFAPKDVLEGRYDLALRARDSIVFVKKTAFGGTLAAADPERFSNLVQLTGRVARPEVFAYVPGMKLSQVLKRDQILLDTNLNYAELTRLRPDGKNEYLSFRPSALLDGSWDMELGPRDLVRLDKVGFVPDQPDFDRFPEAVLVRGSASFPGLYAWKRGDKLSSLLALVKPLAETNQVYAELLRPQGGDRVEYLSFAPREIVSGLFDLELRAKDQVLLFSLSAAQADKQPHMADPAFVQDLVTVSGSARYAGPYARTPTLKLSSVVTAEQLLEETNIRYAELTRLNADGSYKYISFSPEEVLAGKFDLALQPKDSVRLVKKTAFGGAVPAFSLDRFADAVVLLGQAARPEVFAFTGRLRLSAVLTKDQMLLDTSLYYAEILRTDAEGRNEYLTFRPESVLAGATDLDLRPRDRIRLVRAGYSPERPDFDRYAGAVQLLGPAQTGGLYAWKPNMRLSELFALAKPLDETNKYYAEVLRPLGGGRFEYLTFAPREVAAGLSDLELKAKDVVRLYTTAPVLAAKQGVEAAAPAASPAAPAAAGAAPVPVPAQAPAPAAAPAAAPGAEGAAAVAPAAAPAAPAAAIAGPASAPAGEAAAQAPAAAAQAPAGNAAPAMPDLNRFLEVVTTSGAVRYAGPYARTASLMLSSVITADQMLEETNLNYAELTRLKSDGSYEYFAFSPKDVLEDRYDLPLRARDSIVLVKRTAFGGTLAAADVDRFSNLVQLTGRVARPEVFAFLPGMKLSRILTKDQILLDTNLNYAELVRLRSDGKNEYLTFRPGEVLDGTWDLDLGPRDLVRLVKVGYDLAKPDFERFPGSVQLGGPVRFPGLYAWREGMKLSSLLSLANPSLDTNQVYAEVIRPLGGIRYEYRTFAPREVAAGAFDLVLAPRDVVRLYTTAPAGFVKQGAEETPQAAPAAPAAAPNAAAPTTAAPTAAAAPGATAAPGAAAVPGVTVAPGLIAAPGATAAPAPAPSAAAMDPAALQAPAATLGAAEAQAQAPTAPASAASGPASSPSMGIAEALDLSRFLEVATISGAARYVGPYARTPGLKLSSVVTADQVLEETNLEYAELTRLNEDGSSEYRTFAPRDVLEGRFDLPLRAKDAVRLVRKTAFGGSLSPANFEKFTDVVQLIGQVARPEVFALRPGMKLSQILTKDQILLGSNLGYAEMVRFRTDGRNEYLTFRPSDLLSGGWDIDLGPRDLIALYKTNYKPEVPDFTRFKNAVLVSGTTRFTGLYAWAPGLKLGQIQKTMQLMAEANRVYADIRRTLDNGAVQVLTFAPREVESGRFDLELGPSDQVTYYSTKLSLPAIRTVDPAKESGKATAVAVPQGTAGQAIGAAGAGAEEAATGISTDLGFYLELVSTQGVVRYVGPYARSPGLKLSEVVTADQMLQNTDLDYAELTRRTSDGGWEYRSFSPRAVLAKQLDLPLRARDQITYYATGYLPEKPDFDHFGNAYALTGRARLAGLYSMESSRLLSEILNSDQLLSDTDIHYAEVERWVTGGRTEYLTFSPISVLLGEADLRIYPRDVIRLVKAGDSGLTHDFSRYPSTVRLQGVIRYPGRYAWFEGLTLATILDEQDLLIDTDIQYAEVRRRNADRDQVISFAPQDIASRAKNLALEPRDVVIFYPKHFSQPVTVSGEVAEPKVIPYFEGMELSSALRSVALNGGIEAYKAVITKAEGATQNIYLEDYFKRQASQKVPLGPGDAIAVKRLLPDEHLPVITVRGAVAKPQSLPFTDGMRLAAALEAAGGYDASAYPYGLVLIRKSAADAQQRQVDRMIAELEAASVAGAALPSTSDSTLSSTAAIIANLQIDLMVQRERLGNLKQLYKEGFGRISLDMPFSLKELAASSANIVLERDDLIFVPKTPTYVVVSGQVADQNIVAYREDITVRQAVDESGWLLGEADIANAYIVRASGKLDSTQGKGFLFFKPSILDYVLRPGDTVVVPTKSMKVSVAWSYVKDSLSSLSTVLTSALTTKTLLGL